MGLQNHLTDVSSDSLPLLLLATIATAISYLRSLIFTFLGISPYPSDDAMLLTLSHHLNLNRLLSYKHAPDPVDSDCVVCLNRLTTGEHVRKLPCHHVFHKECFDGWLHHLNFNCPLCRSPVVFDERVVVTRRRQWWFVNDVIGWFDFRR
ncbi:putative transcription factor C2H2 family [Helianthus anomalus]